MSDQGLHPKDQWFTVYEYTDWSEQTVVDEYGLPKIIMLKPTWGPKKNEPQHLHHPDSYHDDPRVRIAHHRANVKTGVKTTACGAEVDPRCIYVEESDAPKCPDCLKAAEV